MSDYNFIQNLFNMGSYFGNIFCRNGSPFVRPLFLSSVIQSETKERYFSEMRSAALYFLKKHFQSFTWLQNFYFYIKLSLLIATGGVALGELNGSVF